jgi:hypothetical protein
MTQEVVEELVVLDDRDRQLLSFLREHAGRKFPLKFLMGKFGYQGTGSTALIRHKLDVFLALGYPVRRIVRGSDSGALWCVMSSQLGHAAAYHDAMVAAHAAKAAKYRGLEAAMRDKELFGGVNYYGRR